ncbi:MAG: hydantoinase/oxoprolinase family protein [Desulfovibrio sp.]|nr:MAG: hydantoinase/oxoprolinase family protein [Desulfovibrio sp.]
MIIIGVDTGGTFTDLVYTGPEGVRTHKLLSTPDDPSRAVLAGIAHLLDELGQGQKPQQVVHGSTVATNAILERKGVTTALITSKGFTDVLAIGRQNRSRLYDLAYAKEPPLVGDALRFGISGRVLADGTEHEPLDEKEILEIAKRILARDVESVAVCLLFAFARPEHEQRVAELLDKAVQETRGPDACLPVSLSHEILSEFREYERCSTTVVNAYVSPKMQGYLLGIEEELHEQGIGSLRIMQSNGGSISAATARREPVRTILSGPAGGAVGALRLGKQAGISKLITFDMGGTSTDVSLINHDLSLTLNSSIASFPVKTPMIDIHTVGAGGGSIARIDAGGALKVGPESAGADPGPICYGKGDQVTVTDANLYLGRLIADQFLGSAMRLYPERLEEPFARLAEQASLSPREVAEGVIAVANANMERAIRVISVERGYNPREFTLFSFGGAGGLHCVALARLMNIPRVLIPENPGILSAKGMLLADVIRDYSRTIMLRPGFIDNGDPEFAELLAVLEENFTPMRERGVRDLAAEGVARERISVEPYLDMRYQGQSHEIMTPFSERCITAFHELHERHYGYANPGKGVEIVNLRLRARGEPDKPEAQPLALGEETPASNAFLGKRTAVFAGQSLELEVLARDRLSPGNIVHGPAVITEFTSTLFLPPEVSGRVDGFNNIVLDLEPE